LWGSTAAQLNGQNPENSELADGPKFPNAFVVEEVDAALPSPGIVEFDRGAAAGVCDVASDCDDPRHLSDGLCHGVGVLAAVRPAHALERGGITW
jgi:hypothetical protein